MFSYISPSNGHFPRTHADSFGISGKSILDLHKNLKTSSVCFNKVWRDELLVTHWWVSELDGLTLLNHLFFSMWQSERTANKELHYTVQLVLSVYENKALNLDCFLLRQSLKWKLFSLFSEIFGISGNLSRSSSEWCLSADTLCIGDNEPNAGFYEVREANRQKILECCSRAQVQDLTSWSVLSEELLFGRLSGRNCGVNPRLWLATGFIWWTELVCSSLHTSEIKR